MANEIHGALGSTLSSDSAAHGGLSNDAEYSGDFGRVGGRGKVNYFNGCKTCTAGAADVQSTEFVGHV